MNVILEFAWEKEVPWELRPWTAAEIQALMQREAPLSGAELVERLEEEGGWEDLGITDSAAWVDEVRLKHFVPIIGALAQMPY